MALQPLPYTHEDLTVTPEQVSYASRMVARYCTDVGPVSEMLGLIVVDRSLSVLQRKTAANAARSRSMIGNTHRRGA